MKVNDTKEKQKSNVPNIIQFIDDDFEKVSL